MHHGQRPPPAEFLDVRGSTPLITSLLANVCRKPCHVNPSRRLVSFSGVPERLLRPFDRPSEQPHDRAVRHAENSLGRVIRAKSKSTERTVCTAGVNQ